jgi:hypothetical protein
MKEEISLIIASPAPLVDTPSQSKFSTELIITVRTLLAILFTFSELPPDLPI